MEIWIAFITGLTTGGISCMVVQGGLLAGSLAGQLEKDLEAKSKKQKGKPRIISPILLFLLAKLVAYTMLGFLLGLLGSMLQLTFAMRAALQIAIGIFMLGNALRMFNVHPFFRIFSFEPPKALTRLIRKASKKEASWVSPLALGALTVLIPCGVTQSMMALALGSGNALFGAAVLFAFVLGTSPVFFGLIYLTARLGVKLEKRFNAFAAVILLALGLLAINSGLNLMGSPFSFERLTGMKSAQNASAEQAWAPTLSADGQAQPVEGNESGAPAPNLVLTLKVLNTGYEPQTLHAPAGYPLKLTLITEDVLSCSRAFVIPELQIETILPQTGVQTLDIPAQSAGKVMTFSCSMGMYTGQIVFDQ